MSVLAAELFSGLNLRSSLTLVKALTLLITVLTFSASLLGEESSYGSGNIHTL